jgi:hypothetical protein
MTDLATLVARLQADNSQYIKALDQATGKLQKFQQDQNDLLSGIADKFAAALSVDALVEFSAHAIESAASLERLSQSAGIGVESLSSLRLAAAAAGIDQDQLGVSLKKLNQQLSEAAGNATSKSGEAFRALGINVKDANGNIKDAGVILGEIADKFQGFADGPNKTAIAIQLLGRQGQQLIPVLNQGSAGLNAFKDAAAAAGITVSKDLAQAAEEFSQKFAVIKATLSEGFGNQLAAQLLPVLNTLADQLTRSASSGAAFSTVAGVIVGAVKVIASAVIEAKAEFTKLGQSIGAVGAAAVAVAKGNFSEASTIWKQSNADNVATTKQAQADITEIWEAGTDQELSIVKTSAQKIKEAAPNLAALAESDSAVKELEKFDAGLKDQAAAFGLGGAALVSYKLQFGPLADAVKKAGDEGAKLAASIRANAQALQTKQDTKAVDEYTNKLQEQILKFGQSSAAAITFATHTGTLGQELDRMGAAGDVARSKIEALALQQLRLENDQAFFHIDQQLLQLSGHLTQAAAAAFDFNNKLLIKNTAAAGTDQQKAQLDALKQAELAQAAYNEEVQKATIIEQQYATIAADVALKQAQGTITDLQAQQQLDAAHKQEIADLQQIYASEKQIADSSGIPQLTQQTQTFANSIKNLQTQTNQLEQSVRNNLESSFADNFQKLISGSESFSAAIKNMAKSIENDISSIVSKNLAQSLFGQGGPAGGLPSGLAGLFGGGASGSGGSGGGGLGSFFSSLFGKGGGGSTGSSLDLASVNPASGVGEDAFSTLSGLGFAAGGTIGKGKYGLVGENGPELAYAGDSNNMQIIPANSGKNVSVSNNFIVQAQGGRISRPSQMQTAAAAARSLQQASRRNNT